MDTQAVSMDLRLLGIALLVTVVIFMIGAFSATYFRQWLLQEKNEIIALMGKDDTFQPKIG